jgi:hypothetical protein
MIGRSLLIVTADRARGWDLGEQLDADGHDIRLTDDRPGVIAKLSTHAIDVVILGELERPAAASPPPGARAAARAARRTASPARAPRTAGHHDLGRR